MNIEETKILIVDDEPDIVDVLKDFLKLKGYKVFGAFGGREALIVMEKEQANLVLLDIMMPDLNGAETAKLMKERFPNVKIIVLTGFPSDESKSLLERNILDQVFIKPVRMQVLFGELISMLNPQSNEGFSLATKEERTPVQSFWIKARLLFIEDSRNIYQSIETHFKALSQKGEHYLLDVASNKEKIKERIISFNPNIILANASFFRGHNEGIIEDVLSKNLYSKEVLVYNLDDLIKCNEDKLWLLTNKVREACDPHKI